MAARLDFWFEFASSYSYPAAMRIEAVAAAKGVAVTWRPFLLGPIFAGLGVTDSPFNLNPTKGRYMVRDLERTCAALALPFKLPSGFPRNGLLGARVAIALDPEARPDFAKALYRLEFGEGADIADETVVAEALRRAGLDVEHVARAADPEVKQALREATEEAKALGVFGAPSFLTQRNELFWGNDRLEDALDWALKEAAE